MTSIHQRIRQRREALGLTKTELGEALGVGYQTIQQWETDPDPDKPETKSTAPKRSRMGDVAKILKVTETWLRTGRDETGKIDDPIETQLLGIYRLLPTEAQELIVQQANGLYTALNPKKRGPANPFGGKKPPRKKK
jgi:transcriptional regulator with XRE-family HTH domain